MKIGKSICLWFFLIPLTVWGESLTLPRVVNFNTVLTDAGGTPLPDGAYEVTFQILNTANESLYSETQRLESVKGVVSAMVGEQGGLNLDLFQSGDPRFLSYEVPGETPEVRMEIVSVPYALMAEEAQRVAPQSVVTSSIQPGAITRELLAEELITELTTQISPESLPSEVVMASELEAFRSGLKAEDIDVGSDLIYSRGTTVGAALRDLDTALHQRQINLDSIGLALDARVTNEVMALNAANSVLNTRITTETGALSGRIDGTVTRIGTLETDTVNLKTRATNLETRAGTLESRANAVDTRLGGIDSRITNDISAAESRVQTNLAAMPKIRAWGSCSSNGGLFEGYNVATSPLYICCLRWGEGFCAERSPTGIGGGRDAYIDDFNKGGSCVPDNTPRDDDNLDRVPGYYSVRFLDPMQSAHYAVSLTIEENDPSFTNEEIYRKTDTGFVVHIDNDSGGGSDMPFSFIVVGP